MMKRVEPHRLKPSSPFYAMLREFCHRSKNLYNHGNYLIRQTFIEDGKWLRYGEVDRLLKVDAEYPDYREMPTAQSAQQTLRILDKNWTSFFAAIKDWKAHPEKYKGRPKLPKYKPKDGCFPLVLTNQNCKLKDGVIRFPRVFQGFTVKAIFASQPDAVFKQARIIPHGTMESMPPSISASTISRRWPGTQTSDLSCSRGRRSSRSISTTTSRWPSAGASVS